MATPEPITPGNTLSIVLVTHNHQAVVSRCLSSLKGLGEIIVIDRGSTDGTLEVVRAYTEQVFYHPSEDFVLLANYGVKLAKGKWILYLEPDEWVEEALKQELERIVYKNSVSEEAFLLPCKFYFRQKWLRHGGMYPALKLRLFRKKHLDVMTPLQGKGSRRIGSVGQLDGAICQEPFQSLSQLFEDAQRQATEGVHAVLEAGQLDRDKVSSTTLFFKPLQAFLKRYLLQRGFQDGVLGLMLALSKSYQVFMREAKVQEWSWPSLQTLSPETISAQGSASVSPGRV